MTAVEGGGFGVLQCGLYDGIVSLLGHLLHGQPELGDNEAFAQLFGKLTARLESATGDDDTCPTHMLSHMGAVQYMQLCSAYLSRHASSLGLLVNNDALSHLIADGFNIGVLERVSSWSDNDLGRCD